MYNQGLQIMYDLHWYRFWCSESILKRLSLDLSRYSCLLMINFTNTVLITALSDARPVTKGIIVRFKTKSLGSFLTARTRIQRSPPEPVGGQSQSPNQTWSLSGMDERRRCTLMDNVWIQATATSWARYAAVLDHGCFWKHAWSDKPCRLSHMKANIFLAPSCQIRN